MHVTVRSEGYVTHFLLNPVALADRGLETDGDVPVALRQYCRGTWIASRIADIYRALLCVEMREDKNISIVQSASFI